MTKLVIVTLATLLGTSAMAQGTHPAYRGSGPHSGGPAYRLNSETGGAVRRQAPANATPAYQRGSGQQAGGPARELNSETGPGRVSAQGTVYDPNRAVPFGQSGSGQRSGGPARR